MSRLRPIDRVIRESSTVGPIDEDDQDLLIHDMTTENFKSWDQFTKFLTLLYTCELLPLLLFHNKSNNISIVVISILMSFVEVNARKLNISYTNERYLLNSNCILALIALAVFVSTDYTFTNYFFWIPSFNIVSETIVKKWHIAVNNDIVNLEKLKYKYKSA